MNSLTLTLGPLATNCYLVWNEGAQQAVVIDPAAKPQVICDALRARGLTLAAILLTHAHFDHIGALKPLHAATGAPIYLGEADRDDPSQLCYDYLTYTDLCRDGDVIEAAGLRFAVLSTPGHTPGSVGYVCEKTLFSGDTLFSGSYGRTDFPGGSDAQLLASLRRLSALDAATRVLPGHGEETTIERERRVNPGMREAMRG